MDFCGGYVTEWNPLSNVLFSKEHHDCQPPVDLVLLSNLILRTNLPIAQHHDAPLEIIIRCITNCPLDFHNVVS